jgi:hypothetical protein
LFKREAPKLGFEVLDELEEGFELLMEFAPWDEFKDEWALSPPSLFESLLDDLEGFRGSLPSICLIISAAKPKPKPQTPTLILIYSHPKKSKVSTF